MDNRGQTVRFIAPRIAASVDDFAPARVECRDVSSKQIRTQHRDPKRVSVRQLDRRDMPTSVKERIVQMAHAVVDAAHQLAPISDRQYDSRVMTADIAEAMA